MMLLPMLRFVITHGMGRRSYDIHGATFLATTDHDAAREASLRSFGGGTAHRARGVFDLFALALYWLATDQSPRRPLATAWGCQAIRCMMPPAGPSRDPSGVLPRLSLEHIGSEPVRWHARERRG